MMHTGWRAGTYNTLPVYNFFDEIIIYIYICAYTLKHIQYTLK